MAIKPKQPPFADEYKVGGPDSGDPLFDVVVEHKIGTVRIGSGKESPFTTAMILIGRHHADETEDATYRFPGAREGEEITVRLEHTWPIESPASQSSEEARLSAMENQPPWKGDTPGSRRPVKS